MKKILALCIALALCLAMVPAFAADAPVKVGVLVPRILKMACCGFSCALTQLGTQ